MKMIALGLVFLFLMLVESFQMKTIFLKDNSKVELSLLVKIDGKSVIRQLYLFSTLSRAEIEERLAGRNLPDSPVEFRSGEVYKLCRRISYTIYSLHPIDRKVCIVNAKNQQVYKFKVNSNVTQIAEARRSETCALNAERFIFSRLSINSLYDIKFGLSEPFRMTLNEFERQGLKFGMDFLPEDLDEIFSLLENLKNEGFEGDLQPQDLDEIVVLGLDGHLKLIVPAVVGTKISNLIDEFYQFYNFYNLTIQ